MNNYIPAEYCKSSNFIPLSPLSLAKLQASSITFTIKSLDKSYNA